MQSLLRFTLIVIALGIASAAAAQGVVHKEAPPEIRAMLQAFTQAANGDAAAWESFAQAHYTDALLKQQTPAQRAEVQKKVSEKFGTISLGSVRREGPDGPLQVMVKGSKSEGTVLIDLDFSSPKIFAISVE